MEVETANGRTVVQASLPKPSDFSYKTLSEPSMQRVGPALDKVSGRYREILGLQLEEAGQRQNSISASIAAAEGRVAAVSTRVSNNLKVEFSELPASLLRLEAAIQQANDTLSEMVRIVYSIDQALPSLDRLVAPNLPHQSHYKKLHALVAEQAILQPTGIDRAKIVDATLSSTPVSAIVTRDESQPPSETASVVSNDARAKLRASLS